MFVKRSKQFYALIWISSISYTLHAMESSSSSMEHMELIEDCLGNVYKAVYEAERTKSCNVLASTLEEIIDLQHVQLGRFICPLECPAIEGPQFVYSKVYLGHLAIRMRHKDLFKVYLEHIDEEDTELQDGSHRTVLQVIQDEMLTGREYEILEDMLRELHRKDPSQVIRVHESQRPLMRSTGFNVIPHFRARSNSI